MDITVYPGKLSGHTNIIPSKSQAHRLLICAAFADSPTTLICPSTNQDIEATARCLNALGAKIVRTDNGYKIDPVKQTPQRAVLDCGESGSTLRFLLPIAGSLGIDSTFLLSGRLPERPLSPLWEEMERMGCSLTRPSQNAIRCQGTLRNGHYSIAGNVSSQFITGLLFAISLLDGPRTLTVTGHVESAPYIRMTEDAMQIFGVDTADYQFSTSTKYHSPGEVTVEGDWSNAAFFLVANALGSQIIIHGLNDSSAQGDRAVVDILNNLDSPLCVNGKDIPDLIPVLAVAAGANQGAAFSCIGRLRTKESDRIEAVSSMLKALGADVRATADTLEVFPGQYNSCVIDSCNDHRIAMSAAVAATVASGPITILNAHCVQKSYPDFWSVFQQLGGHYEQYIR